MKYGNCLGTPAGVPRYEKRFHTEDHRGPPRATEEKYGASREVRWFLLGGSRCILGVLGVNPCLLPNRLTPPPVCTQAGVHHAAVGAARHASHGLAERPSCLAGLLVIPAEKAWTDACRPAPLAGGRQEEARMAQARLKIFGWGREGEGHDGGGRGLRARHPSPAFRRQRLSTIAMPTLDDIRLRAPRIAPPAALAGICSTATYDRAAHAHGKGFTDAVRALLNDFSSAPDVVAYPRERAGHRRGDGLGRQRGAALTPFGGGSSVVGGVDPARRRARTRHHASISPARQGAGDRPHLPRRAHPGRACSARRWRTSCGRTASRCGTSRRASNIRRWAAGSPPARAGISPRSTPISTISWKACAW